MEKNESWLLCHIITKINLKCSVDLNVKCKLVRFLEVNIKENLQELELGKECLDIEVINHKNKKINWTSKLKPSAH